ncbi:MAG: esterase-like activity of phytase family protein [Kofleriaceae bacterium]
MNLSLASCVAIGLGGVSACGKPPAIDHEAAAALFTEVPVTTAHGLSGLAADAGGALWTVAERDPVAYRISLDAALRPTVESFAIRGVPAGIDLEGIAVLDDAPRARRFAFGTEGQLEGTATVLRAERVGDALQIGARVELSDDAVGLKMKSNQGAEGICGSGETLLVAIEGAGQEGGRRWAPVLRVVDGAVRARYRVWLTSDVGKLSGLDCRLAADGSFRVLAIERHFAVTKVLRFTAPAAAEALTQVDLTPEVVLDLGPVLRSGLNLEGVAWTDDGRVAAVVDNQWRTITGPSELLVFRPGVVAAPR